MKIVMWPHLLCFLEYLYTSSCQQKNRRWKYLLAIISNAENAENLLLTYSTKKKLDLESYLKTSVGNLRVFQSKENWEKRSRMKCLEEFPHNESLKEFVNFNKAKWKTEN